MSGRTIACVTILTTALLCVVGLTATGSASAQSNPDCLYCHETTQQFTATAVDKDTACRACHTPGLLGTHPYHQAGSNCGAYCHPGWGTALYSAVPAYLTSAGSFASPDSQNTDPGTLHVIHAQARWPKGVDTPASECASCHSAVACDACHAQPMSPAHDAHSSTAATAYPEHTRQVGYGIIGEDQTVNSVSTEQARCGTAECHDILSLENGDPLTKEDFSHPAYPTYGWEENVVAKTGSWGTRRSTNYTSSQMSYSNDGGATLSLPFSGNKIALISDLDPYRGQGEVWIDGSLAGTFDSYSPTTKYQRVVWASPILVDGPHTVEVRVLDAKQAAARATWVSVDAFKVWAPMREYIAPDCDGSCHSDKATGHGGTFMHEATQTAGTYPSGRFACTECHTLSMWAEHDRASSKTEANPCLGCHTTYADYTFDEFANSGTSGYGSCTWAGDGSTTGCHQVANGQDPHNFTDADHDASGLPATADCRGCHGDDISFIHDDTNASRGQHASLVGNGWATDCLTCHGPAVFPSTKDCTDAGCHVGTGVISMTTHPAPTHDGTGNNSGVARTGGLTCSACHQLALIAEHGKASSATDPGGSALGCLDCHNAGYFPAGWLGAPGTSNTCIACHPVAGGKAGPPHEAAEYTAKHVSTTTDCSGASCHAIGDVTLVHRSQVATTLFADGFESGDFSAWDPPAGFQGFVYSTDPGTWPPGVDNSHHIHSGTYGVTIRGQIMKSVPADGDTRLTLSFWLRGDDTNDNYDWISVYASQDGTSWANVFLENGPDYASEWTLIEVPIPDSYATADFGFYFYYSGGGWDIDDVSLTAEDGGPNPTTAARCDYCHDAASVPPTTDCYGCHGGAAPGHDDAHAPTVLIPDDECVSCHVTSDVRTLHAARVEGPCAVCHDNPTRGDLTWVATTACGDCHAATHVSLPGHITPDADTCSGMCHHSNPDVSTIHYPCNTCHTIGDTDEVTAACTDCHQEEGTPTYHPRVNTNHTRPIDADTQKCVRCHTGQSDVRLIHGVDRADSCNVCHSTGCSSCHWFRARGEIEWLYGPGTMPTTKCQNCHGQASTTWMATHGNATAYHLYADGASCVAVDCHASQSLDTVHVPYMDRFPAYEDTCALCHLNGDSGRIDWDTATADCASCHTVHP